jgi:hypothetical protein
MKIPKIIRRIKWELVFARYMIGLIKFTVNEAYKWKGKLYPGVIVFGFHNREEQLWWGEQVKLINKKALKLKEKHDTISKKSN